MKRENYEEYAEGLLRRISESTSPVFTVLTAEKDLQKAGFQELPLSGNWKEIFRKARENGNDTLLFYTKVYGTTLFAFAVKDGGEETLTLRMASAHTDFPCFQVKPSPDMKSEGCLKLNVEDYGGMIKMTWPDRPLSLSGRVVLDSGDPFCPEVRYVDLKKPVLTIPNLAIHMNRDVNKGKEFNTQVDLLPLCGTDPEQSFLSLLAAELGVKPEAILDTDLKLYPVEEGCLVGFDRSLLSSARIDNLSSCFAAVDALIAAKDALPSGRLNAIALYDNEEVGSSTKQGAASVLYAHYLEKLYDALGRSELALRDDVFSGLMFSVDVAHATHPNAAGKSDPTNPVRLNGGVVLKQAASQRYASDTEGMAIAKALCKRAGIPCQVFVNRSDQRGGSTLGAIASTMLPMRTVDMGMPILAMHSCRELTGTRDPLYMEALLEELFL